MNSLQSKFLRIVLYALCIIGATMLSSLLFNFVNPWAGIVFGIVSGVAFVWWLIKDIPKHFIAKAVALLLLATSLSNCDRVTPEYDGVLMTNYGQNGESDYAIVTGKVNTWAWGTELTQIPRWEQRGEFRDEFEVQSKDGGIFKVRPIYTFQRKEGNAIKIAFNYNRFDQSGEDLMNSIASNILGPRILTAYLDAARTFTTDSLMYNGTNFDTEIRKRLTPEFDAAFVTLKTISSGLKVPESMRIKIEERNNMIQETEKVKNQSEREKATLDIMRYKAQQNEVVSASITPNILRMREIDLENRKLDIQEKLGWWWYERGCPTPQVVTSGNGFYGMVSQMPGQKQQ